MGFRCRPLRGLRHYLACDPGAHAPGFMPSCAPRTLLLKNRKIANLTPSLTPPSRKMSAPNTQVRAGAQVVAILKTTSTANRQLPILDDHIWSAPAEVRFIGTTAALWIALRVDRKCRRGPVEIGRQSKAPSPLRSAGALQIRYASLLMTAPALVRFADHLNGFQSPKKYFLDVCRISSGRSTIG